MVVEDSQLIEALEHPIINEALFLASPDLHSQLLLWKKGALSDPSKVNRLRLALLKYLARISSRSTPFGLFAGCTIGTLDRETELLLTDKDAHHRVTHFDMHFLVALSQYLQKQSHIKKQLKWYPNSSLYKTGDHWRYVEYTYVNGNRIHSIEGVSSSSYLEKLLSAAKEGLTIDALSAIIIDDEVTKEEAFQFIDQLIENQLLISELEPSLTGSDFLSQLIAVLAKIQDAESIVLQLKTFEQRLAQLDKQLGNDIENYKSIVEAVKQLHIPVKEKFLFQTDLFIKTKASSLSNKWMGKMKRCMRLLNKLTPPPEETNMQLFKNAFLKRYETKEMPLTTVLDVEMGIGYLQSQRGDTYTPFVEDLRISRDSTNNTKLPWNTISAVLNKKVQQAIKNNSQSIELEEQDFQIDEHRWDDLPDTMASMVSMTNIEGKEYLLCSSIGGGSAAKLLGRFCHGHKDLKMHVEEIVTKEADINSNTLLAEIVHLPEDRVGNVIKRPALRSYEIPYLGKSLLPKDQQIPVEDLMISVKGNHIQLRSKRLNKNVRPYLTNAHNFSNSKSLPIYRFLCELNMQNKRSGVYFNWGSLTTIYEFLPRVVFQDIILSAAQWNFKVSNMNSLFDSLKEDDTQILKAVQHWQQESQLPQHVQLADNDNTLLINLHNVSSIKMLLHTVKQRKRFVLKEFLFSENSPVKDEQGNYYANELVIGFYKT
ncbi:lantibiotic dehydratase family protein [Sungkyunkwania multivorans]|uniref:Lantibiotic dehydratase family protein n=1 Tax=Sungkyunkwania multivorans TaxID=1173618 RepID=A0ABW3CYH1_9FLAO